MILLMMPLLNCQMKIFYNNSNHLLNNRNKFRMKMYLFNRRNCLEITSKKMALMNSLMLQKKINKLIYLVLMTILLNKLIKLKCLNKLICNFKTEFFKLRQIVFKITFWSKCKESRLKITVENTLMSSLMQLRQSHQFMR